MDRLDKLRQTTALTTRDAFLKIAAVMIDELNGLALDMHNLLDSEVPEDVWKRYRNGDRSVFARRLFKIEGFLRHPGDPAALPARRQVPGHGRPLPGASSRIC